MNIFSLVFGAKSKPLDTNTPILSKQELDAIAKNPKNFMNSLRIALLRSRIEKWPNCSQEQNEVAGILGETK